MTCREVTEFLMDYVAKRLSPEIVRDFEYHLSRCANCRTFLAQYQDTVKAGQGVLGADADDAATVLPDDVLKAIMDAVGK